VNEIEAAELDSAVDLVTAQAECEKLPPRDVAVLAIGDPGDSPIQAEGC
jgi:hypothetical protein